MGMYNIIDFSKRCPSCSAKVEWQTKGLVIDSMYPIANVLKTYTPNRRMSGEVYTYCSECKTWVEAKMKNGKLGKLKVEKSKD